MPRPLRKTSATSLKLTPEVRFLWERCAEAEDRSLTNMFEVMVRQYAKRLDIQAELVPAKQPAGRKTAVKNTKN